MAEDDAPFEDLYREDRDLNFEGVLFKEAAGGWNPSQDIDWDQPVDIPQEKKKALADGATQYHYSNTTHLMLCGRLLERGPSLEMKKLALYLAFAKMRNIDVWGRYLGKLSEKTEVPSQTRQYFQRMTEEDDTTTLLLGMGVLGGTVGYGTLDVFRRLNEPILTQIADKIIEQKKTNEQVMVNYLKMAELSEGAAADNVRDIARFYREQSREIVYAHSESFRDLGVEPDAVADAVIDATDQFYRKIGLELDDL